MDFARCDTKKLYPLLINREEKSLIIFGLPEGAVEEFDCLDFYQMSSHPAENGIVAWIQFTFDQYEPLSSILSFPDVLVCILYENFHTH